MSVNILHESPAVCVTPLYHFESDSQELVIPNGIRVVSFDHYVGPRFDEITTKYFEMYEPRYLLLNEPLLSKCVFVEDMESAVMTGNSRTISTMYLNGTMKLFAQLRLFKPGRLRAGETFLLVEESGEWQTLG